METGVIRALAVFTQKGQPGRFLEGKGIEGDRFADGGPRQVSLMDAEVRAWMDVQEEKGLCFARYKENLLVEGLARMELGEGRELSAGTARLQVTDSGKRCFPECPLLRQGKKCRLSGGICYACVTGTGEAAVGDRVSSVSQAWCSDGKTREKAGF